jgi:N-glycosylase/DNA lyase
MLFNLSQKYGERKCLDGYSFYTFPTPAALARTTVGDLASCGLGYRAKYLSETAKKIHERSLKWDDLRRASYEEAKKELLNFAGIGQKVADCILLFSLEKLEAFPVDVWVRRVILNYYGRYFPQELLNKISQEKSLTNSEYTKLNMFGRKYFGEYAGYAQEYMYHYERMKSKQ